MAVTRQYKSETLSELKDIFTRAKSVAFLNFTKLTVSEITELRKNLREKGVGYKVAKKTLINLAQSKETKGTFPQLDGSVAITYSFEDEIAPAREVASVKALKDKLTIQGGIFENAYQTKSEMQTIASIPDLQGLRGMFVNIINVPLQSLVIALDQIALSKSE